MKNNISKKVLVGMTVLLLSLSTLTGCGGADESSEAPIKMGVQKADDGYNNYSVVENKKISEDKNKSEKLYGADAKEVETTTTSSDKDTAQANALTTSQVQTQSISSKILNQRKVIRNAFMTIEVDNFEKAYTRIKTMINVYGFIQESNVSKQKVYVNSQEKLITNATIVLRVDKDKFDSTMSDLRGIGTSLEESIKGEDVTDKFFDTESRLRLLKYEQSRLEEYLKKLTDPDTIFKTESRLTDIRQEIEGLTGTLNKWQDLVDLSTITVNINEKMPKEATKNESYWSELGDNFKGSFGGVFKFCSSLLLGLATILPVLLFLGIIAFIVVFTYKKTSERRRKKLMAERTENADKKNDDGK